MFAMVKNIIANIEMCDSNNHNQDKNTFSRGQAHLCGFLGRVIQHALKLLASNVHCHKVAAVKARVQRHRSLCPHRM